MGETWRDIARDIEGGMMHIRWNLLQDTVGHLFYGSTRICIIMVLFKIGNTEKMQKKHVYTERMNDGYP